MPKVESPYTRIDRTVLDSLRPPSLIYWAVIALLLLGVATGALCWIYQIAVGIGAGGQNIPVAWGTYLINFVFWVGIAHSGTLISAILHLFRAGWRNPIARAAETMTVFAVCIAGLFPFIHLGRVWVDPLAQLSIPARIRCHRHQHLPHRQFPVLVHGDAS